MPQFEHNRASIHYESVGDGKPLLLIAGTAHAENVLEDAFGAHADRAVQLRRRDVVAVDAECLVPAEGVHDRRVDERAVHVE